MGDSNTYGYDPRSYLGGRYASSARWTALLKAVGWKVTNEGENGRCNPRLVQEAKMLSQAICRAEAELVTVMLGSNDLIQQSTSRVEVCAEQMEQFLTSLLEELPASYGVLLIAPPPMKMEAWVSDSEILEESHRLAGCYETLVQKLEIHFADEGTWDVELSFDGVHFSEIGHQIFAKRIQRTLNQIVFPEAN